MAETREIVLPDGRAIAYIEVGDPAGPLVIHNHGGPDSRCTAPLFAEADSEAVCGSSVSTGRVTDDPVRPPSIRSPGGHTT